MRIEFDSQEVLEFGVPEQEIAGRGESQAASDQGRRSQFPEMVPARQLTQSLTEVNYEHRSAPSPSRQRPGVLI